MGRLGHQQPETPHDWRWFGFTWFGCVRSERKERGTSRAGTSSRSRISSYGEERQRPAVETTKLRRKVTPKRPWQNRNEVERTWRRPTQEDRRRTVGFDEVFSEVRITRPNSEQRIEVVWRTDTFHLRRREVRSSPVPVVTVSRIRTPIQRGEARPTCAHGHRRQALRFEDAAPVVPTVKSVVFFNHKGGVGKTTLVFGNGVARRRPRADLGVVSRRHRTALHGRQSARRRPHR